MKKKLQVFISSTYTDLIVERQAAVSAILKLGHIPAGMELFTANDKSQWATIKRWIEESDIYMLILGGRYGSIEPESDLSYTELEYDYAIKIGKPLFATVINTGAIERKAQVSGLDFIERENTKDLELFRNKVLSNMSSFWDDVKDIKLSVMESIPQLNSEYNLYGWIPGNEVPDTKTLVDEISELKKENNELKSELKKEKAKPLVEESKQEIEFKEIKEFFLNKKIILTDEYIREDGDDGLRSLYTIFVHFTNSFITGLHINPSTSSGEWFETEVLPAFGLYDLVTSTPEPGKSGKLYSLTGKGKAFAIFLQRQN